MIEISIGGGSSVINSLLDQVPGLVQKSVFEGGLRPAGNVVKQRLAELAPSSSQTGSRKKWSAKTKSERAGKLPLNKTTALKILRGRKYPTAVLVGFKWPEGNIGHTVIPMEQDDREQVLWGKRKDGRRVRKEHDIMKRAFDESRSAAAAAFERGVASAVQRKLASLPAQAGRR